MKTFKIPVEWESYGVVEIEAETIEEAINITKTDNDIPLPEAEYMDGSWKVTEDKELIRCVNEPLRTF